MTTQLLATELANLIQESKRKHNDLRQASEKSLEELRHIGNVSEQEVPEALSTKVNFVNPFIIACGTKNAKFTGIAIVCLQRLIVARALPRTKLDQVLDALMQASSAGLDVQLKILQALPSLLQNYASDIKGDLLVTALNICFILQSSKNAIVNNTSAATLQQLIVSVFDKVVEEDKNGGESPVVGDAPALDGGVQLRSAALDAYRVFNDLCLMTEGQRPEFLRFSGLPQTFGLELIESVLTNHAAVFTTHPEQAQVLRTRVMPLIMSALTDRPSFSKSVRLVRILYTILRRHINILPSDCGRAVDLLTQLLDHDTSLWKRALCLEVFRGIFAEYALVRRMFALYDAKEGEKDILKQLVATFVRLSTEKPAVIGLGTQSTMPATNVITSPSASDDQAMLEASGVGIISASVGTESSNTGISTQWSYVRVPCIDQLDKTDPPPIPESYIYSLILSCISSLSDGLAKFILPLTVPGESRNKKKLSKPEAPASATNEAEKTTSSGGLERSASFKKNPVPLNPLTLREHPLHSDVQVCAAIIDQCWPAILATCSTFLYAALDSEYYHGLVRAFQRFAHVAGLLQLSTPRDAFLTTLGKAAVPPNVLTACLNQQRPATPVTPSEGHSSLLSNARNLLSVESLASTAPSSDKRRVSSDVPGVSLNTRNLLCLRALLNLGIALGPTLGSAWGIILETLQQADFVLFTTGKNQSRTSSIGRGQDSSSENDSNSLMANFNNEVRSVETAASRLIDSTIDFPNGPYVDVVKATCGLLTTPAVDKQEAGGSSASPNLPGHTLKAASGQHRRAVSFSGTTSGSGSTQEYHFALAKLGDIATINIERLLSYSPDVSGWGLVVDQLTKTLNSDAMSPPVRVRAAEIFARLILDAATTAASLPEETRGAVQLRILESLHGALKQLIEDERRLSNANLTTDIEIHKIMLEGLKSVIEGCGESLISGWDVTFEIIGSVFLTKTVDPRERRGSLINVTSITTLSSKLVRSSFNSLQLICSDFLATLPNSCFLILVDTLYKFCSQHDDLNIALTTVTFFWVLSDFLSGKNESLEITASLMKGTDLAGLEKLAASRESEGSEAALWMLLLLRLTTVASDDRLELRNSAIQTLLRIFDAYGDRLSPEAWSICIKSVIFKLLSSLEDELAAAGSNGVDEGLRGEWNETAVVVLNGISSLLANYLDLLTAHPSFNHLWRELLGHFKTLLDFEVLTINTATFKALGHVLAQTNHDGKPIFNTETVHSAWDLWSRGTPVSKTSSGKTEDNQECLIAYVSALREVYRLVQGDITAERVQQMLTLLRKTVEQASIGTYVLDVEYLTPLQAQVLEAIQMIRTDVAGVPSAMVFQMSEFVTLAYNQDQLNAPGPKRTYVAMSKASMKMLETLVLQHASDVDLYRSGAFSAGLTALREPIVLKYDFPITTKSIQPWKLATSTVLAILGPTLPHLDRLDVPQGTVQEVWTIIVAIAGGIMSANCERASSSADLVEDERFDIGCFHNLRQLVVPSLGAEVVPDSTRQAYAEALFRTSIIHSPPANDAAIINSTTDVKNSALLGVRRGQTVSVPQNARTEISYVAIDELFALVATEQPRVVVQPATPMNSTFKSDATSEPPSKKLVRIARVAAPFLILRCALTLRAYVSDQPLRGKMPQPLSQRKELIWILRKLVDLKSESKAMPGVRKLASETRNHLFRLYPLLVKALVVDGDGKVLELLREALDVVGTELGV